MEKANKGLKIMLIVLLAVLIVLFAAFVKEYNKQVKEQFSGWHLVKGKMMDGV